MDIDYIKPCHGLNGLEALMANKKAGFLDNSPPEMTHFPPFVEKYFQFLVFDELLITTGKVCGALLKSPPSLLTVTPKSS